MKYYLSTENNDVCAFEPDGSQDNLITGSMRPMSDDEVYAHLNPPPDLAVEAEAWAASEMIVVAEQLLMLDDEDPKALPGTARQWRDYRIALRNWTEGAPNFPDEAYRPTRPA